MYNEAKLVNRGRGRVIDRALDTIVDYRRLCSWCGIDFYGRRVGENDSTTTRRHDVARDHLLRGERAHRSERILCRGYGWLDVRAQLRRVFWTRGEFDSGTKKVLFAATLSSPN